MAAAAQELSPMDRVFDELDPQVSSGMIKAWRKGRLVTEGLDIHSILRALSPTSPADATYFTSLPHVRGESPPISMHKRYQFLDDLVFSTTGSAALPISFDHFSILAGKGCFIPPQINPLGATWICPLAGSVTWTPIPSDKMMTEDWDALGRNTSDLKLGESQQAPTAIKVPAGGTLLDPASDPSVFSTTFTEMTYLDGGTYWDVEAVLPILRSLHTVYWHPAGDGSKKPSLQQFLAILVRLRKAIDKDPARFTHS
ncbi:hypothetical protein LTR56_014691 [Elasticomyces elasticus]|nr:hypothetical protein LTR56_014691 [Elasticomyces elasticus]KAK3636810.1 hypothetical protein LTR22_018563 [Elasticomyces elasticus]KAK4912514.1 hypothetical protein LTR49_019058 [Elasticomyces elasticus]KAK5751880.1 hypothetical protein LTS12_018058 [Elasticomyces elasticus]